MYTADFNIEADKLESLQQILEPKLMAEQTGMAYLKMRIDSVEKTFGSQIALILELVQEIQTSMEPQADGDELKHQVP